MAAGVIWGDLLHKPRYFSAELLIMMKVHFNNCTIANSG